MSEFEQFNATSISTKPDEPVLTEGGDEFSDQVNAAIENTQKKEDPVEEVPTIEVPTVEAAVEPRPVTMVTPHPQPGPNPQQPPAQPQAPQQPQLMPKRAPITSNEHGLVVATNLDEEWRICTVLATSGMVPKGMNTPEKVFVARQFAAELKLPQMTALRNICVINGTPSLWGDLPLAMVRMSGLLENFNEYWTDKDGNRLRPMGDEDKMFAAVCEVKRKGQDKQTFVFTEFDVKVARLDQKDIWKLYPRRMRQMRARSWALKDIFGDVLLGAAIAEYDFDHIPGEGGEVTTVDMNKNKKNSSLNDKFGDSQGSIQTPNIMQGAGK